MSLRASVVIRTKDEADRLRLALTSLACQDSPVEVVVVNDGSSDHTHDVISEAARSMNIVAVHHERAAGRSAASNAGAAAARGDIAIFLDGDTLAAPGLISAHLAQHRLASNLIVRGTTCHLRSVRPFLDPETGSLRPGEPARPMQPGERSRAIVTREQIRHRFSDIDDRAQLGIYPGFGPRRLCELEMDALIYHPDCPVLWIAASGNNMSVDRQAFLNVGGFHPAIDINEHRELALRLCKAGLRMRGSPARSYHLVHRRGWRDPLQDKTWEDLFYAAHPLPEVALLAVFWSSLSDPSPIPDAAKILSLPALAAAADRCRGIIGREAVRDAHVQFTREPMLS